MTCDDSQKLARVVYEDYSRLLTLSQSKIATNLEEIGYEENYLFIILHNVCINIMCAKIKPSRQEDGS